MEILRVPIQKLRRHEGYKSYGATMAKTNYLLSDPGLIQPAAIEVVLEALPIIAIRQGRAWEYISGHRTAILAASVLGVDAEVPIRVIRNPGAQRIRVYIAVDIMADPSPRQGNRRQFIGRLQHHHVPLDGFLDKQDAPPPEGIEEMHPFAKNRFQQPFADIARGIVDFFRQLLDREITALVH